MATKIKKGEESNCPDLIHISEDMCQCRRLNEKLGHKHGFTERNGRHRMFCEELDKSASDILCMVVASRKKEIGITADRLIKIKKYGGLALAKTMMREIAMKGLYEKDELVTIMEKVGFEK